MKKRLAALFHWVLVIRLWIEVLNGLVVCLWAGSSPSNG
jgi:hypothetical protein